MNSLTKRLQLSVSVSAFAAAFAAMAPHAAIAQPATGTDSTVEEVTVTGTNIRGIAPVGSHVDAVTQEDIQAIAPISISEVVNTLPVISQANTLPQDENSYAFFSPNIHHLSSSNGNSTLVVIDGMRMAGGGSQGLEADPNIIPTEALARVEVLADGASSIYGSDAVAGVVNFITRKSYEGLEVNGQAGFGKGYNSQNLDMIWGTKWDGGGVYIASSYSYGSNIPIRDRRLPRDGRLPAGRRYRPGFVLLLAGDHRGARQHVGLSERPGDHDHSGFGRHRCQQRALQQFDLWRLGGIFGTHQRDVEGHPVVLRRQAERHRHDVPERPAQRQAGWSRWDHRDGVWRGPAGQPLLPGPGRRPHRNLGNHSLGGSQPDPCPGVEFLGRRAG